MPFPASRLTDMHLCPMVTPGTPPIPHVGGPITGPGAPTVITCGLVQSVITDMAVCVGPPDTVVMGAVTVLAMGKPCTRITSSCAHGGAVILGAPTVLVP
ncbi:MAG: PAAR domain-containing protein [Bryobacter sp.]|nr:PAAR domain-containing protein [Bryobacter sp.]